MKTSLNLFKYTDQKDIFRPALAGIFHTIDPETGKGVAVATDQHVMVVSEEAYNPELNGKIEMKNGDSLTIGQEAEMPDWRDKKKTQKWIVKYPKWETVLPKHFTRDWMEVPSKEFFAALRCAQNFEKNAPQTYPDGKRIPKNHRTIRTRVVVAGHDNEDHEIYFNASYLALFMEAIGEDGRIFVYKGSYGYGRRSIYGESRNGTRALVMPITGPGERVRQELDEKGIASEIPENELYVGSIWTANLAGRSEEAARLYATPEKKERVPQVKVIRPRRGYAMMDQSKAVVKQFPAADLRKVEGLETMYTLRAELAKNFRDRDEIYKFENGYFVYLGTLPENMGADSRAVVERADKLTIAGLIEANKWDVGPVLATYFERTGQQAPVKENAA